MKIRQSFMALLIKSKMKVLKEFAMTAKSVFWTAKDSCLTKRMLNLLKMRKTLIYNKKLPRNRELFFV